MESQLINQGSYGCIYHPGLNCKSSKTNTKFITKIQRERENSMKEVKSSNVVKTIKNYKQFFGPIENSCDISISKLQENEIKKCEFMVEEPKKKYVSNKIRYIGTETLSEYLVRILKTSPNKLPRVMLDSYMYLLKSLSLLGKKQLVHMDLKENNILIEQKTSNPIIIDFGLTFQIKDVTSETSRATSETSAEKMEAKQKIFFTYGIDYIPWCIDIAIITYINKLTILDVKVTIEQITQIIEDFSSQNPIFQYYSEAEKTEYVKQLETYFSVGVGKSWGDLIDSLINVSIYSWDNYALAAIYYQIICDMKMNDEPSLMSFIKLLKSILLAMPDSRINSDETIIELKQITTKVFKSSYSSIRIMNKMPELKDQIDKNHQKTKLALLKKEEQVQKLLDAR